MRALRRSAGLTGVELARLVGVSQSRISRIETGHLVPQPDEVDRLASALKLDAGVKVGVYAPVEKLVASGYVWKESLPLLASRSYLMHEPSGRGHVIAFAEDPNYRAYAEATELLFINAVLLSGGH